MAKFTAKSLYDLLGPKFGAKWHQAAGVAMAESSGDPNARSPNPDGGENRGLFQIDTKTAKAHGLDPDKLFDPAYNAYAAKVISGSGKNWKAWATMYSDPHNPSTYGSKNAPAVVKAKDAGLPDAEIPNPVLDPISGAASGVVDAATAVPKFLGKLGVIFDGTWWLRVGMIGLGILAMGMAVSMFAKQFMPSGMPVPIPI